MNLIRCRDGVFYWRLDGAKKTVRCHGGIPEMVSSNFHGTPPYDCFHPGTNMFCGVWHFAKQSVAAWIVLDGVQDYETKCASLMSDGKSWKAHWRLWMFFLVLVTFEPGSFQAQKTWPKNQDFAWPYPCQAQGVGTPSWWVFQSSLLHDTATASWMHDTITASMLWHHRGITSLTPFRHHVVTPSRHHFFDTI